MQLDVLSIPWALVSTEDLMPACRTPIQHFVDHYERSHRWSGEWWPAFQHISAWKRWKGKIRFIRCVLYYFGTFCKRSFDFFVRFSNGPNSECCETIALELASYPNNLNSSNGFSSHLSLIPAWQSTSSCSKQNWKADLKGCFEVGGPNRRGGKALKNCGYQTSTCNQSKGNKEVKIQKVKQFFFFWNFQLFPKEYGKYPHLQWLSEKTIQFLEAMHSDQQALGELGVNKNIAKIKVFPSHCWYVSWNFKMM